MKKLLLIFACLLFFAGTAYGWGTVQISGDNTVIVGPNMGPSGITPFVEIIKVNVGSSDVRVEGALAIGDVMVWNLANGRSDGYRVWRCTSNKSDGMPFAGVLVELPTSSGDTSGSVIANSTSTRASVAGIAIRGFCQAKIDASVSALGQPLVLNGATLVGSFQTKSVGEAYGLSQDIGILLDEDSAVDGLYDVWLR